MQNRLTEVELYDAVVNHGTELKSNLDLDDGVKANKSSLDLDDGVKANYAKFGAVLTQIK